MPARTTLSRLRLARSVVVALASALTWTARADAVPARVILPDADNLQYMSFWVAKGAGYFREEGADVELLIASAPPLTEEIVRRGEAPFAVLPPPMYIDLIAEKFPIVLVANLLQNDPINLVVRRSFFEAKKLRTDVPVGERLKAIEGATIGIAPNPPSRLRALFASQGLDADLSITMKIIRGPDQNAAFANHEVDVLYAHTPYVETALVEQDAVLLVNQSAGEVPQLATRQIHGLVVTRAFANANPKLVLGMTRAIYRAQKLVHASQAAAVDALAREFPSMSRARLEKIVSLYAPAIPDTPAVAADRIAPSLAVFPATRQPPDLSAIPLADFVDASFAAEAVKSVDAPPPKARILLIAPIAAAVALVFAIALWALRSRRRRVATAS